MSSMSNMNDMGDMGDMSKIIEDVSSPEIPAAIQVNFAEKVGAFAHYYPGAELHEDAELQWFTTPSSAFNSVLRTSIVEGDIEAKIVQALAYFKNRSIPMAWLVGPVTQPANLDELLQKHGLAHFLSETGMAVVIQHVPQERSFPHNFRIEVVNNEEMLHACCDVSARSFGDSELHAEMYYTTYTHVGFGEQLPWQHYLGLLDGRPVATSMLFLHAGVAGIYDVATLQEVRGQRIGTAMTLAALDGARKRGYRVAVLNPTEMGLHVYQRLGFIEYCQMNLYR